MVATPRDILQAALALAPEERETLAHELLASLPDADDGARDEVVRRAREVREGRTTLVDGPSTLRSIRERLQTR